MVQVLLGAAPLTRMVGSEVVHVVRSTPNHSLQNRDVPESVTWPVTWLVGTVGAIRPSVRPYRAS